MNPSTRIASMGLAVAVASAIVLGGCASSLSGVGGVEGYACKAPIGAQCTSVSGVYANAGSNARANANLNANSDLLASRAMHEALRPQGLLGMLSIPFVALKTLPAATDATTTDPVSDALVGTTASLRNAALRSPARVLRLWIAPWEDADGDLHEASFLHVVIDTGRWLVERVRPAPRSRMDIATPPLGSVAPTAVPQTSPTADLAPTEP
jgi:conjugal transfer pilus assembly protein TraV